MASVSTWSGIRNKLEQDYLCPALRRHIQYFATSYRESHDQIGRAAIRMDGIEILRSNYYDYEKNYWNRYQALRREGAEADDPKAPFRLAHEETLNDGSFDNVFFYEAFRIFDKQIIEKSLVSENPLVRIFALLDRRLGKRRLLALEESMEQELDWVRVFYVIRMQAEGLMVIKKSQEEPPCRRSHPFLPCGYMDHAWAASRTMEELDAVAGSHIQEKNSMTHGMIWIRPAINSTFRSRTWKSGPTGTGI